ncbi:MAG: flagellar biosynthesis protein FlgB [Bacteroidetes bacterium]|nr:flagellar biosynthesis protein FlgB [Rhodothermaceae bacterium RA]RMH55108.1 MAG: flagellar biosynthesis protein FlgB [Bacteroidota bacterium]
METPKLSLLRNAMQAYAWRTKALTSNLANLDTPGYRRLAVTFEETLQDVRTRVPGLRDETDVHARLTVDEGPPVLEDEMMDLADTQMRTQLATRALSEHFSLMRTGITGRTS